MFKTLRIKSICIWFENINISILIFNISFDNWHRLIKFSKRFFVLLSLLMLLQTKFYFVLWFSMPNYFFGILILKMLVILFYCFRFAIGGSFSIILMCFILKILFVLLINVNIVMVNCLFSFNGIILIYHFFSLIQTESLARFWYSQYLDSLVSAK